MFESAAQHFTVLTTPNVIIKNIFPLSNYGLNVE